MATTASRAQDLTERIQVRQTSDRILLRAFLERDRLFAAYAICDLDDREFNRTRWGGAFEGDALNGVTDVAVVFGAGSAGATYDSNPGVLTDSVTQADGVATTANT